MTTASGRSILRLRRRAAALLLAVAAIGLAPEAHAQDALSPLPPPVTRSQYRGQWFEFLSAFSENDTSTADKALEGMLRAGRKVGVHRLSDFSRTAVYLGHRAERQGATERAARAYAAALKLDDSNPDAILAHLSFLFRHGKIGEALRELPGAAAAYVSTREARVAIFSSLGLWIALGIAGMFAGAVLALAVRHFPRAWHDIAERAGIDPERVVVDPGIGFFRRRDIAWHDWDCAVLAGLDRLRALGRPICVGASRKSFIGRIAGEPDPARRLPGSLAAATAAVLAGAHLIRAHDVGDTVQAVRVAEAVRGAREHV